MYQNLKLKNMEYYYIIWAGDGYNATDKQYFSAELAIRDAVRYSFDNKEKVWIEFIERDESQIYSVKYKTIFRLDYNKIMKLDKKII